MRGLGTGLVRTGIAEMITVKKNVLIAVPREVVFAVVDDTANIPELWPSLSNVRNLKRIPNGGHSFQFDFHMAGITVGGTSVDLEYDPPKRIVTRTTGSLTSTLSWTFLPQADGEQTDVNLEIEYEAPLPLIGRIAEKVISRINDRDVAAMLEALKAKSEHVRSQKSSGKRSLL